ncbi:MAG TPA: GNAT family N-acetyltransferase [Myxococcales bacterium]
MSLITSQDSESWRAALPARERVMGSLEYARICERRTGFLARLFLAEWDGGRIAYPTLLRPLEALPFAGEAGRGSFDTFTPEYTGPLRLGSRLPGREEAGLAGAFAELCRDQRIVAEFAHLSPFHGAAEMLDPEFVECDRQIVYVDLSWGLERIWSESFTREARRHALQAARLGVRVRPASSPEDVLEFHRLYELTMDRVSAADRYRFPPEHFLEFFRTMSDHSLFLLAEHQGRAVAGGLYLFDATDVYWHFSAADLEHSRLRAVNGCQWEAIKWAARAGKRRMLLGGGHAPRDGLLRFKGAFSPLRMQFRTYRRIHDPERYAALVDAWAARYGARPEPSRYFPAYRSDPPAAAEARTSVSQPA